MPHYLHQVAYSREGWEALVKHPQDRIEAVRPAIEKLGGKIKSAWFAFGEYDVVVITEMPDNVSAAIQRCKPWAVDVASGIESSPGRKNHARMKEFIEAALHS